VCRYIRGSLAPVHIATSSQQDIWRRGVGGKERESEGESSRGGGRIKTQTQIRGFRLSSNIHEKNLQLLCSERNSVERLNSHLLLITTDCKYRWVEPL